MGQRVATILPAFACAAAMLMSLSSHAQNSGVNPFTFNFNPLPTEEYQAERKTFSHVFCNLGDVANYNCDLYDVYHNDPILDTMRGSNQWYNYGNMGQDLGSNSRTTRFVQEVVTIEGVQYYHLVIGEVGSAFAQEVYIAKGSDIGSSGGFTSASGGVFCLPSPSSSLNFYLPCAMSNNAADPLWKDPLFTGNRSGDPTKVIMKQVINTPETGFSQEFLKSSLAFKPKITQTAEDEVMTGTFVMDMSNSDYNTNTIPGLMTNSVTFKTQDIPAKAGDFILNTDSNTHIKEIRIGDTITKEATGSNITAGRYTHSAQTRETLSFDYVEINGIVVTQILDTRKSEYTYHSGNVDSINEVNWETFRDPAQNDNAMYNTGQIRPYYMDNPNVDTTKTYSGIECASANPPSYCSRLDHLK